MDFTALMKDIQRLDKINKELQELQKPDFITEKAETLKSKALKEDFTAKLDNIIKDLL